MLISAIACSPEKNYDYQRKLRRPLKFSFRRLPKAPSIQVLEQATRPEKLNEQIEKSIAQDSKG